MLTFISAKLIAWLKFRRDDGELDKTGLQGTTATPMVELQSDGQLLLVYSSFAHSFWRTIEVNCIQEELRRYSNNKHLTDWGCGDGSLSELCFADYDIHGFDPDIDAIDAARFRRNFRSVSVDSQRNENSSTTVISISVFEHTLNYQEFLNGLYNYMNSSEILIISFPTIAFTEAIEKKCGKLTASKINEIMLHRNLLTEHKILDEIKKVGFDIIKRKTFLSPKQVCVYINTSVLLNKKLFLLMPRKIKFILLRFFTKKLYMSKIEDGTNLCLVLRKP